MLGWVILVTTLFFLLYVTTMSFKVNNSSTNSTLVTSVDHSICGKQLCDDFVKKCKGELFLFWFGEEKCFSLILSMTELFHLLHITIKHYYKLLCLSCPHCQSSYYT